MSFSWKFFSVFLFFFILGSEEEKENSKELYELYKKMMERNKKRFKAADFDGDGKLSRHGK